MELSLQSPLHALQGVGETRAAAFARLGLQSVRDLLLFFPRAYENRGDVRAVAETQDGQLCDIMVDKAALEAIYEAGKRSGEEIIRDYAESTVAVADIKIAVRSQKTAKSLEFMKRAMAECDSVNINALMRAAQNGMDAIEEYLESTAYKGGAKALKESASAFECWCDNRIVETIRPQLYNPFTIGPVVAYVLARENEIKTVRIILTGKQNDLPVESIRERVREMYV